MQRRARWPLLGKLSGSVYCSVEPVRTDGGVPYLFFEDEESNTVPEQPWIRFFLALTVNRKRWMARNQDVPVRRVVGRLGQMMLRLAWTKASTFCFYSECYSICSSSVAKVVSGQLYLLRQGEEVIGYFTLVSFGLDNLSQPCSTSTLRDEVKEGKRKE